MVVGNGDVGRAVMVLALEVDVVVVEDGENGRPW